MPMTSPVSHTAHIRTSIGAHAEVLRGIVQSLDPDDVLASRAPGLWAEFDRIERLAAAAKTLLARRVDDSRVWEREGHRSVVEYLAEKSGTSKSVSRGVLATSKKIGKLPATQSALRRGQLSTAQAECVADAASHNRDAEEHLLGTAKTSSLGDLRDECARKKAAADPDPDATYRRIHEGRFCRQRRDPEGGWCLTARGTPDAAAVFNAALNPIIDEIFSIAWAQGRREERQQYAFDALIELAERARRTHVASHNGGETNRGEHEIGAASATNRTNVETGDVSDTSETSRAEASAVDCDRTLFGEANTGHGDNGIAAGTGTAGTGNGNRQPGTEDANQPGARSARKRRRRRADSPTYLALLRIDFTALQRGHTQGDEVCEIAGVGPIPVRRARELLSDAVIKLIATKGEQVANVTHYRRSPNTAQRVALLWSQPTCSVAGCDHSIVQIDHRHDWHKTQRTRLEDLDPLCPHHHRLKTYHGWALVAGTGKRAMVPPQDPRHPDNQRQPAPAAL
jgi:hypothetical protein